MSRVRFPFRSTPSTQQVPTTVVVQTPEQKKESVTTSYWDGVYSEDGSKDGERLWGIENFGNTCYCNSVLQALYACQPFRAFVEAYPSTPPPVTPLGPPPGEANLPIDATPSSPLAVKKENPFDAPPTSPTGEKRGWKLGRKPTITSAPPTLASIQAQVKEKVVPPSNYPALPEPNPDQPPPNVFETIQTLFQHLSLSPPHQPLPSRKDPKKEAETIQTASLLAPEAAGEAAVTKVSPNEPQGPPLLASLPPPSAPRGGGPFSAGSLGRGVVRPEDVLKTIKRENEMFRGMAQQDAHEFLGWVLNKVAEEVEPLDRHLKSKGSWNGSTGGKTFVQNLFEGSLTNETRCLSCETHTSVTSCLRGFSASEMLCQKNKFYCDSCCGLQEAEKRMKIKRLPHILPLHLKRFKYQESLGRYTKLFYRVPFPTQLRLPNTSDDAENPDRLYELFAVVVHIGNGPHHGHYVCLVKSAGRWVMCDDENVEPIDEADIFRYFGDYPSGAGYVMFYQAADLDLGTLGLNVPPPAPKPAPKAAVPAPVPKKPVPETLVEVDEPTALPQRSPPATHTQRQTSPPPSPLASPVQRAAPAAATPLPIQRSPMPTPEASEPMPSPSVQRTPSQIAAQDSKWYQRKKNGVPPTPPAATSPSSPLESTPPDLTRRTSTRIPSGASATSGAYAGGGGLGRKLSGISGKGLMSRSGSLMKLGLGKKKEGIDE